MENLKYFHEERELWDKAVRFEEKGKRLNRYWLPTIELTLPYTPLTWLMVHFINHYYLNDIEGFEEDSPAFWERVKRSGIYQYEVKINQNTHEYRVRILKNIVTIYQEIKEHGFNLAKPVPVTENNLGEIVPLKGAKRIAALLVMGIEKVPVMEYDRSTLINIRPKYEEIACINHSDLIFNNLTGDPGIRALELTYSYWHCLFQDSSRKKCLDEIRAIKREMKRQSFYKKLLKKPLACIPHIKEATSAATPALFFVIGNEIELIEWLFLRRINCVVMVVDPAISRCLRSLLEGSSHDMEMHFADSGKTAVSGLKKHGCKEFWCGEATAGQYQLTAESRKNQMKIRILE
jgi:hypothetical protein